MTSSLWQMFKHAGWWEKLELLAALLVILLLAHNLAHGQVTSPTTAPIVASDFGRWTVPAATPAPAGASSVSLQFSTATATSGPSFSPVSNGTPLLIIDTGNSEIVTPSNVNCPMGGVTCSFTATFTKSHLGNFLVSSGTFGLQEAINYLKGGAGGTVQITQDWPGTTAMITGASGSTTVSIQDVRNGLAIYTWNGSIYVQQSLSVTPFGNGSLFVTTNLSSATNNDCAVWLTGNILGDLGTICGNATQIQGRAVASTPPADQQALAWSAGLQQWVPTTIAGGGGGASLGYVLTTFSATPTFTPSPVGSCTFEITLTGNVTSSSFTSGGLTAGTLFIFIIHQDATGGRTFVWPTTANGTAPIGLTPAQTTVQQYVWNGSALEAMGLTVIYP